MEHKAETPWTFLILCAIGFIFLATVMFFVVQDTLTVSVALAGMLGLGVHEVTKVLTTCEVTSKKTLRKVSFITIPVCVAAAVTLCILYPPPFILNLIR